MTALRDNLYGHLEELRRTATVVRATGISVQRTRKKKKTGIARSLDSLTGKEGFDTLVCCRRGGHLTHWAPLGSQGEKQHQQPVTTPFI